MIWGRFRGPEDPSETQDRVLTHSVESSHGSKNLLQRAILYRHKEILLGREDWSFEPGETTYTIWLVFH